MSERAHTQIPLLVSLAGASMGTAALGLVESGLPPLVAAGFCAAWIAVGWPRLGVTSLVLAAPALAVTPWGGWCALIGWSVAGFAGALAAQQLGKPDPEQLRALRGELRDAEHERTLLHRHIQRYPALLEACLQLSAARELDQFAKVLCAHARELLPEVREVLVFLGSATEQSCRASSDRHGRSCARAAGEDELYVAAEARSLIRRGIGDIHMYIPLRGDRRQQGEFGETLRGVLVVSMVAGDVGDRLALELLGAFGRLGGLGLAAVDLVNQARGLALRDDLTGLYGQHEFLRRLDEQAAASRRHAQSLGVIMCDMDHLKRFNDTHGHLAGDAALRAVAQALTATLPSEAIACRYGGEEFAAIVVGFNLADLAALGERVREAIARIQLDPADASRRVTASIGVAVVRSNQETARAALKRADAACYRAKANGRNRREIAE